MNRDTAFLHIRSVLEEVAEEHEIPENVLYAATQDEAFLDSATTRLLRALPEGSAAGDPNFDLAAADFAEGLQDEALALLKKYISKFPPQ